MRITLNKNLILSIPTHMPPNSHSSAHLSAPKAVTPTDYANDF